MKKRIIRIALMTLLFAPAGIALTPGAAHAGGYWACVKDLTSRGCPYILAMYACTDK